MIVKSKAFLFTRLKKNIFESSSKIYVNEFLVQEKKINSDIIETHNSPYYIQHLKNTQNKKKTQM